MTKQRSCCGGWGYIIKTADQTVWDVPTVRVECPGCAACRAYRIELDIGGSGDFYIVTHHPQGTIARRFKRAADAEEWIRTQTEPVSEGKTR